MADPRDLDLLVVGAGFGGLHMLHRARGMGLEVQVVEAADGVGGTWWWNRYPGARCDVESLEYSYSWDDDLQQEWHWSERYAGQPEILRYLEHVADRHDLRRDIRLSTRVTAARWDGERWRVEVEGEHGPAYAARYVVMATGCLSSAMVPDIPGRDDFAGRTVHTGRWPHEGVDVTGLRVGVVGTGSSGIQAIPLLAEQAAHLTVFQRTPAYSVPARNGPLDPAEEADVKARYAELRAANLQRSTAFGSRVPPATVGALEVTDEERRAEYERRWERGGFTFLGGYTDLFTDPAANETAADFVRERIRAVVRDPEVAERLVPSQMIGCKRLCLDTGYFETYNRPNVRLVDLRETPIDRITPSGVVTGQGAEQQEHELDVLVFATGFDAMTGALSRIRIEGRDGLALTDAWQAGPRTYLGLMVHGFPNLFAVTGPGSPSVLTNMVPSIEHHVGWIGDVLAHLAATGRTTIEPELDAQDRWVDHVNGVAAFTIFPTCSSWYLGANVPGKTRVFMPLPGFPAYAEEVAAVVADGYRGFALA